MHRARQSRYHSQYKISVVFIDCESEITVYSRLKNGNCDFFQSWTGVYGILFHSHEKYKKQASYISYILSLFHQKLIAPKSTPKFGASSAFSGSDVVACLLLFALPVGSTPSCTNQGLSTNQPPGAGASVVSAGDRVDGALVVVSVSTVVESAGGGVVETAGRGPFVLDVVLGASVGSAGGRVDEALG